ncbi:MAG: hypothetical protein AAB461_03515 [Patescibacteria group bacterium]
MRETIEKTSLSEQKKEVSVEHRAIEKRADEIIDAAIKAVFEINKKINEGLLREREGTLADEAHQKNPLDEAHILELELHYPAVAPLVEMLDDIEEPILGKVENLIVKGEVSPADREIIKEALSEYLARSSEKTYSENK